MDALFARVLDQLTRERRAHTARLPWVGHGDCELGTRAAWCRRVPRHADDALRDAVSRHGDKCHRVMTIDLHHAFDEFFRRLADRVHQPVIAGRRAQAANEIPLTACVFRADRANDVVDWQL